MGDDKVTVQWVKDHVDNIRTQAKDAEAAHSLQDQLYEAVLGGIACGALKGKLAMDCAAEALKTRDIIFRRWTA